MPGYRKRKVRRKKTSDFWTMPEGVRLHQQHEAGITTSLPPGCGIATLLPEDLTSLRTLCDDILKQLTALVPWGDGWTDRKSRGYAMLPNLSDFPDVQTLVQKGILMHDVDASLCPKAAIRHEAAYKHDYTVKKSFASIELPQPQIDAIQRMIEQVNAILQEPSNVPHLQPYERNAVNIRNLAAIQPNFHNGDDYLPLHLDNPRHDGFGVVIVTVALWGAADVVLVDDGDAEVSEDLNFLGAEYTHGNADRSDLPDADFISDEPGNRKRIFSDERLVSCSQHHVQVEGGILFKDGNFMVTRGNREAKNLTGAAGAEAISQTIGTTTPSIRDETSTSNLNPDCTNTTVAAVPEKSNPPVANNTSRDAASSTSGDATVAGIDSENNISSSTSWVFPLHPGQLYVLSGPARNKCAHGIVVHPSVAPNRVTLAQSTIEQVRGNKKKSRVANASAEPGVNTTVLSATSNTTIPSTTAPTHRESEQQPEKYKGRVSLNFRFGIHTPEQATHEIDRHWG